MLTTFTLWTGALGFSVLSSLAGASTLWTEGEAVPPGGRSNPFGLSESALAESALQGRHHALIYPVETTPLLMPERAFHAFIDTPPDNPLRLLLQGLFKGITRLRSSDAVFEWLGLHPYPGRSGPGALDVPFPGGERPRFRMGYSPIRTAEGTGFTFSCAACHSANLFGRKIIGMTNRFPRANEFFLLGRAASGVVRPEVFQAAVRASEGDTAMYSRLRRNARWTDGKLPTVLGLDTSIAQVALSLSRREPDEHATRSERFLRHPRPDPLRHPRPDPLRRTPADSKPAVWWNAKYKNRWLSDGSVVAGNPILTNILWNEIGRGADLVALESWIGRNLSKIEELTNAVFSSEAPLYTDFFGADSISLDRARRGQTLFGQHCARCHGTYAKAWDQPGAETLSAAERLRTVRVLYPERTRVVDVGTDPLRRQGMRSLEEPLNRLAISRRYGVVVREQKGYVPPPLVGIWARWPYFHNNSAPSLCAVLTRAEERPAAYYAGEALDPSRDFDPECNGYPLGAFTPTDWRRRERLYDTRRPGLSNRGHDEGIFLRDGRELMSRGEKGSLIEFLRTL